MKISEKEIKSQIAAAVEKVRSENPMAPSITNTVTIEFVANAQLAVGGSAAMVYLPDEGEAMAAAGKSLYINMGTQLPVYAETLTRTCRRLLELNRPWVLDPVGIGIGGLRMEILLSMKDKKPGIIRGNASEIIALANLWGLSAKKSDARGVDTTDSVDSAKEAAKILARHTGGAVAISGPEDFVTDGENSVSSRGGSKFMPMITGAGCSLGGVMAIYATSASPFIAALTAVNIYNIAGLRAEKNSKGPGTFHQEFLDELYKANPEDVASVEMIFD